jgi:Zn-dependent peptidase ImmA (M78 family)
MAVRRKIIRAQAEQVLQQLRIKTAPVEVKQIAEALGAEVQEKPTDDKLSGFLFRDATGRRAIIGVNSLHPASRQRFTIAHEIGHLLLHKGEPIHVDRLDTGYTIDRRNSDSSKGEQEVEIEANLFAAELLMPKKFIDADLAKHERLDLFDETVLQKLAMKYKVSLQALTYRLAYLGYIR